MRSVILRFSDAELEGARIDTVGAHEGIAGERGWVWWGWWKKKHEPLRGDLLDFVRSYTAGGGKLPIGLVNRKGAERLFFAECIGCAFSSGGQPISSPDPDATPSYYRAD